MLPVPAIDGQGTADESALAVLHASSSSEAVVTGDAKNRPVAALMTSTDGSVNRSELSSGSLPAPADSPGGLWSSRQPKLS
ncbi:hypothetical protein IEQ34_004489 [Dendrobium chrysotoxum]|uniref:Uncharacterized protein n=1 Tax=Dendrobium chrysotoxum TaxID=161865 RepID=A0AAV7HE05_DENCH|nr:hypothetical protein IEQ34_004489 [Dendrobium chrysotoxum]